MNGKALHFGACSASVGEAPREAARRIVRTWALSLSVFFCTLGIIQSPNSRAQSVVSVGAGSYASWVPVACGTTDSYYGLPANQVTGSNGFYTLLHMDPSLQGRPIPTNHWWTDLLIANRSYLPPGTSQYVLQQDAYGGNMWFFPGLLNPQNYGLDLYFPNAWQGSKGTGPNATFDPGPALSLHGDRGFSIPAADILVADFEAGYPTGWTVTTVSGHTNAFGSNPARGNWTGQAPTPNGYVGNGLVNTYLTGSGVGGNGNEGILSGTITIQKNYLNFLVGGGNDVNNTVVRLKVGGTIVLTATGQQDGTLRWNTWNVSPYLNQAATIELVDTSAGSWGFIMCDEIVQSDSNQPAGRYGSDYTPTNTVVTNWGDWNVDFKLPDGNGSEIDVTMARGIPFTWTIWKGTVQPKLMVGGTASFLDVNSSAIVVSGSQFTTNAFSFNYQGRTLGIFLPDNTVVNVTNTYIEPQLSGSNNFMVIGYLPDAAHLAEFAAVAFAKPTNTQFSWSYNPANGYVATNWAITTTPLKGSNLNTIQGWLPHHYRNTATPGVTFKSYTYLTPRGVMKCASGTNFQINFPFSGMAPVLPAPVSTGTTNDYQPARMQAYLNAFDPGTMMGDTYWSGKALALCAQYMSWAYEMGDTTDFNRLKSSLESAFDDWLVYTPGETQGFFAYYSDWHALIGWDASYGSQAFNDLHFHYGYFAVAAATLGMYDRQFLTDYGPMLRMIVKSYGNWDRTDTSEPFLRTFDVWEGHSNAGGTSGSTGENEESSSEGIQGFTGMFLLGSALNDSAMTAAGAMGFAMESQAINEYWEDLWQANFPSAYGRANAGQVWADSYNYGTYFSGDPAWVYAIQYCPASHILNYLTRYQTATVAANYQAMWTERANWCAAVPLWSSTTAYAKYTWVQYNNRLYGANAAVAAGNPSPDVTGTNWSLQADCSKAEPDVLGDSPGHVVLVYQALFDPNTAAAEFDNYYANGEDIASLGSQAGSSYYHIHAMRALGQQDFTSYTTIPTSAVYSNTSSGVRSYVVFNPQPTTQSAVVYNNGVASGTMTVPGLTTLQTTNPNYVAAVPAAPSGLAALSNNGAVTLSWLPALYASSYNIKRATQRGGPYTTLSSTSAIGCTDPSVSIFSTYFYVVSAVNSVGESANSQEAALEVLPLAATAVNCGGTASGVFVSDTNYSGGTTSTTSAPIDTSGVSSPAPQAVYQTSRFGGFTYTLSGFTAGASYLVRLHFAETYWSGTGQRMFNVKINGTTVLTNFDIMAASGGVKYKAVVQEINAAANSSGQFAIQFTTVKDNSICSGIEIRNPLPAVPTGVTAASGAGQVTLGWNVSLSTTNYNVYRAAASGGPYTLIASVSGTNYTDSVGTAGTTYYYVVTAVNTGGETANSTEASAGFNLSPIQQWRQANFGAHANGPTALDTANPTGDGISNLMKYALGMDPHVPSRSGLPVSSIASGTLALSFNRACIASDVTYRVEACADLVSWSEVWNSTGVPITGGTGAVQSVTVPDTVPVASAPGLKRFLRLKVTRP